MPTPRPLVVELAHGRVEAGLLLQAVHAWWSGGFLFQGQVQDGWFRVMYVAKFDEAIYVLHSFQKKTRKTPRNDIEIARQRYRAVVAERKASK